MKRLRTLRERFEYDRGWVAGYRYAHLHLETKQQHRPRPRPGTSRVDRFLARLQAFWSGKAGI